MPSHHVENQREVHGFVLWLLLLSLGAFYAIRAGFAAFSGSSIALLIFGLSLVLFSLSLGLKGKGRHRWRGTFAILAVMLVEFFLAMKGPSNFSQFFLLLSLFIFAATLISGLAAGTGIFVVSMILSQVLLKWQPMQQQLAAIEAQHEVFAQNFFFYIVATQFLSFIIMYGFRRRMAKGESDFVALRLRQANNERRSALVDSFGSIAHEINNSLAIMNGASRMMHLARHREDGPGSEKYQEYLDDGRSRLKAYVEQMKGREGDGPRPC